LQVSSEIIRGGVFTAAAGVAEVLAGKRTHALVCADALAILPTLPDASFDAVVTDPPYPCIDRDYGYWTEEEWWALMRPVVAEVRRVLKPSGSAVFVLQPNSERVGRMRPWLFEFQAWVCREWNMVQDAYWWNTATMAGNFLGLMRPSVKPFVWAGPPDCYRNQDAVLWSESQASVTRRATHRMEGRVKYPSGHSIDRRTMGAAADARGGVTPFNVLPVPNTNSTDSAGANGHGAGTPLEVCSWWVRYVVPPEGIVLDPFSGTATVGKAALKLGRRYVGIEKEQRYHEAALRRLAEAEEAVAAPLFDPAPTQGQLFGPP
jgi:DNA modification methylase